MLRRGPPWSSVLPRVINARRVPGRLVAPRGHRYSSLRLRGPANEARQPLPDTVEVTPRPEGLPAARAPHEVGLRGEAVVVVAHSLFRTIYHVLAESTDYREPGADYYDRRQTARTTRRAVAQLERLGYRVTLAPAA